MHIFSRYLWLYDLLLKHPEGLTRQRISDEWLHTNDSDFSRNVFISHIDAIQDIFHVTIACDTHHGYCYKIVSKSDVNVLANNMMLNYMSLSNTNDIEDRIIVDRVGSDGLQYLSEIVDALRSSHMIKIQYQPFFRNAPSTYMGKPFGLKLYERRWYVVGKWNEFPNEIRNFPLDRIKGVETCPDTFQYNEATDDPMRFYRGCIGTWVQGKPEIVEILAKGNTASEWEVLPFHHSQEILSSKELCGEKQIYFKFHLCVTDELALTLLAKGDEIEVLKPQKLRTLLQQKAQSIADKYK